jgi:hypothetical protein
MLRVASEVAAAGQFSPGETDFIQLINQFNVREGGF